MPRCLICIAVGLAAPLWFAPVAADEVNLSANPTGTAGAATRLVLADTLWHQGLTDGQPLYLLTAIQLARSITLQPATGWERTTDGDAAKDAPLGRAAAPDPASEDALSIVRNLAEEYPALQEFVYDLDAQLPRRPAATAVFAEAELIPGQTHTWRIVLFGEVSAELGLIGDGDSLLSLTLVDETGAEVCATPLSTDAALCRLTPARNGFFTLVVEGRGSEVNSYRLIGN